MSHSHLLKRAFAVASLALLACAGAARAVPEAPLQLGDHGPAVRRLQHELGLAADGVFGPGTQHAVRALQRAHRLGVDGVAGPATWTAANQHAGRDAHTAPATAGTSSASRGHAGSSVRLA